MRQFPLPLLFALLLPIGSAWAVEDVSKVNGSIKAEAGQAYGDLETVNGSIRVGAGATTHSIETVNGGIDIEEGARTGSVSTVNGKITLGPRVTTGGNVETVNGSIFADRGSQIEGGVETVNGGIGLVETRLRNGIKTVNGDITVGIGSQVEGGIHIEKPNFGISFNAPRKPRVIIGPKASVAGELKFERDVVLYVHRTATIGPVSGAQPVPFDTDTAPAD
ncbi:hypothetical protein [Stenotrophomonas sp.]|uniref:hypothetical protein n=1 Tax=Stenotrophomonas sp. TaxID=69392 RepID=UPI0028A1C209|nr:hypothetical protein [Stenotrophomonas sp.]